MKKYFIVLILGLFLGMLFAKSVYGQENYFTPGQTMKASQGNKDKEVNNFYFKQYTYPYYIESGNFFETKYAIYLQNVKYSDIEFALTYFQPYIVYSDIESFVTSIQIFISCLDQNIDKVSETIEYCRFMGYEDEIIQSLSCLCNVLYNQYSCIQDYALKCLDAYKKEDYASCIKYILQMENKYWELYIQLGTLGNSDGTKQVSFIYTTEEELEQESEELEQESEELEDIEDDFWWWDSYENKSF